MAANYDRPKPIDPVWYRRTCYIRLSCACGRTLVEQLGDFARARHISDRVRIYQILDRMKCSACGQKPTGLVSRDPHGA